MRRLLRAALIRVMTVIGNLRVYYIWGKLLLHLGQNVITFRTLFKSLLHLGQNVITFRALLHLKLYYISGRLLHLGLLQEPLYTGLISKKCSTRGIFSSLAKSYAPLGGALVPSQSRSQSSSAISDVTSPVKLVGKIRLGRLANNGKSKMAASSQECDFSQDS